MRDDRLWRRASRVGEGVEARRRERKRRAKGSGCEGRGGGGTQRSPGDHSGAGASDARGKDEQVRAG